MLELVEELRLGHSQATPAERKSAFGQYFTPAPTARLLASLFEPAQAQARLLDAGAGAGALSVAFIERSAALGISSLDVEAFERDDALHAALRRSLSAAVEGRDARFEITGGDFIEAAVNRLQFRSPHAFTHAVLNPPYRKIGSRSRERRLLRQVELEAVNLYAGFVALALGLLQPGGQLVAIIPRSFCNGPYYKPFRRWLLGRAALRHVHLFDSRVSAFRDDGVLQENVVIALQRSGVQGAVNVSHSTDETLADYSVGAHPFSAVVSDDEDRVFQLPPSDGNPAASTSARLSHRLGDLDVQVSTGPVVDFRVARHLCPLPEEDTVPLLYPNHFSAAGLNWPRLDTKKANALRVNDDTRRWLFAAGSYAVVRRMSSKEEPRRVVAGVVTEHAFAGVRQLGFENHLNVFHRRKGGLPPSLAFGLATYLNSSLVDEAFRRFNGHTQVNVADLVRLRYPSREDLEALGAWAADRPLPPSQAEIDERVGRWLA